MHQRLYTRFRFFKAQAGFATPPGRAARALALARAEMAAHDAGITFVYKLDSEPSWALRADGAYFASRASVLQAVLEDADEAVILWGRIAPCCCVSAPQDGDFRTGKCLIRIHAPVLPLT